MSQYRSSRARQFLAQRRRCILAAAIGASVTVAAIWMTHRYW